MKRILLIALGLLLAAALPARAQWLTQTIPLKAGWNAVYLHVDASHDTLENLVGADGSNPILEVWMWAPPASTVQFVQSPQAPLEGAQWMNWNRADPAGSLLQRAVGNAAYLVRVAATSPNYHWSLKGRPVPPAYHWTTTGLNFLGFPTVPAGAPSFEDFLDPVPDLRLNAEIYRYPGGPLGSGNPARVFGLRNTPVTRGHAFWIRSGTVFNRYFAPFELTLSGASGLHYRDQLHLISFRLRNLTAAGLPVTMRLIPSEQPPPGQAALAGVPPLWVRGALNLTDLTHDYTPLPVEGTHVWTLPAQGQPAADIEVVIALDRSTMEGAVGSVLGGVLRFTDGLGYSQVDIPVSAIIGSSAGLWVGTAQVNEVRHYLTSYEMVDGAPLLDAGGRYVPNSTNDLFGAVMRPFPLRLIVHNPEAGGQARLMQSVFVGIDAQTNKVVANTEALLSPLFRSQARRITASHLPWSAANPGWAFDGALNSASFELTATVPLDYNDHASNPFLHTYHPDHDNLDARYQSQLPQGSESYTVRREIMLRLRPPEPFVGDPERAGDLEDDEADEAETRAALAARFASGQVLHGEYLETITFEGLARAGGRFDTRTYEVRGTFSLHRITDVPQLSLLPPP
jgi:hypothetical protein